MKTKFYVLLAASVLARSACTKSDSTDAAAADAAAAADQAAAPGPSAARDARGLGGPQRGQVDQQDGCGNCEDVHSHDAVSSGARARGW